MRNRKPILLVEDDRIDAMTFERALKDIQITNPLFIKANGEEALHYLKDENNENPCIILTDLNMPKMNGIELIKVLKEDENLKRIPILVLTTSKEEQDRAESFELSVAGYIIKPVDYLQFVEAIKTVRMYWSLSELPE